MTKGEQTKQHIIQRAAELFNKQGFSGASISDLMASTGLKKGGIYRHFESKEQLAQLAFDYAQQQYSARINAILASEADPIKQLHAFVEGFRQLALNPPIQGGCPIMNTIVDSDDGDPALQSQVREVISGWQAALERAIAAGIAQGRIAPDTNSHSSAAMIIAIIEGGILLSRVHRNKEYVGYACDHAARFVARDLVV